MVLLSTCLIGQFDCELNDADIEKRSSGFDFFPFSNGIYFVFFEYFLAYIVFEFLK